MEEYIITAADLWLIYITEGLLLAAFIVVAVVDVVSDDRRAKELRAYREELLYACVAGYNIYQQINHGDALDWAARMVTRDAEQGRTPESILTECAAMGFPPNLIKSALLRSSVEGTNLTFEMDLGTLFLDTAITALMDVGASFTEALSVVEDLHDGRLPDWQRDILWRRLAGQKIPESEKGQARQC